MTIEQLQQQAWDSESGTPLILGTTQAQLVRRIQLRRGSEPCFKSEKRYLCKEMYEWSPECRKLRAHWLC